MIRIWPHAARPSTWGCDHEWERIGLADWGYPVDQCQHCPRQRMTDLDGSVVATRRSVGSRWWR